MAQPADLTSVRVHIVDWDDPSRVLFSFTGSPAELAALPGVEVVFAGNRSVLVKLNLAVPAGVTGWLMRMDIRDANGNGGHADTMLFVGGLTAWRQAHNGLHPLLPIF